MSGEIFNSEQNLLILKHLYTVDGYITFNMKVKSGEYAGASNFCIQRETMISVLSELIKIHDILQGTCDLRDNDSDAYVKIEMEQYGHIRLSGQIGGSHEDNFLKFQFKADQTLITKLIHILQSFIQS